MDEYTKRCLELHYDGVEMDHLCRDLIHHLSDSMIQDGAHHKRWFLQEAVKRIQASEVVMKEEGVIP